MQSFDEGALVVAAASGMFAHQCFSTATFVCADRAQNIFVIALRSLKEGQLERGLHTASA